MGPKKAAAKGKKGKAPEVELKAAPPKPKKIPPPPACFTPEQLAQFKELFTLFDEAGVDKIELRFVPQALRTIGLNPTNDQIKELFATFLEDDMVDMVEYHEFLLMIEKKMEWGDDIEAVVQESLKNLAQDDEETGFVNLEYLKEQLMTWGDVLVEAEFVDWGRLAKRDRTFNPEDKAAAKGKKGKAPEVELKAAPPKPKKIPPPPACFTPEQIAQFKELFKLYDEAGVEKIELRFVPIALRTIGLNPTNDQIKELFATFLEDDMVDMVEFFELLFMIEKKMQWGDDIEAVVVESLKNLAQDDEETGFVNLDYLKEMLMTWADPLEEIEFVDWVKLAKKDGTFNPEDGTLRYEKFVENMNKGDKRFFPEPINYFKLDQHQLLALAMEAAAIEAAETARVEAERAAREEARRAKMIADGLIQ